MDSRNLDQEHLVNSLKTLNPEVLPQFVDHYSGPLFRVILTYTKNASDAEEILQDTFFRVIRKIETFRGESDIWFWMKKIAVNNGLMWLRRHRARTERTICLEEMTPTNAKIGDFAHQVDGWSGDPEDVYSKSELGEKLCDAIKALPLEYRVPLVLKDIEGYSSKEIAALLGLKQPTTNTRIHRARLAIRKKLACFSRLDRHPMSQTSIQGKPLTDVRTRFEDS